MITEITQCKKVQIARENNTHPCYSVVNYQDAENKNRQRNYAENFQLPEPWNGQIETAEILFISSNPGYNSDANTTIKDDKNRNVKHESFPTINNKDKFDLPNFFESRFDDLTCLFPHIHKIDDDLWETNQSYWYALNKWTGWILKGNDWTNNMKKINLLKDYSCLTEIVHCKSQHENELSPKCEDSCIERWMRHILDKFNGRFVVIVGDKANEKYHTMQNLLEKMIITIIKMPHPNPRRNKPRDIVFRKMIELQININDQTKYLKKSLKEIKQEAESYLNENQIVKTN